MEWLISNSEPEALNAPVLSEELLQAGIMREILHHLPWYKKTRRMEVMLAGHLISIIRSGFERSFLLGQMESLDIPPDIAERFLRLLEEKGCCHFGQPRYFYNPVQSISPYTKGVAVQSQYRGRRIVIPSLLAECLQLLRGVMPRESYQDVLEKYLGRSEYAEQSCRALASRGLLMSCDSTQTPVSDYGVQRWNLELENQGELLSDAAWDERLDFMEESFQDSFFQSKNFFFSPPVRLYGDLCVVTRASSPEYFASLSFKLQRFPERIPVNLRAQGTPDYERWQQLRLQSPVLFDWSLTLDLRQGSDRLIQELVDFIERERFSHVFEVTLLLGDEWPAGLALLNEHVRLKLYSTGCVQAPLPFEMSPRLRHVIQQYFKPYRQREGCGAALSLYIDGQGDVYTCSLEGGTCLGHIKDGARAIEQSRRFFRRNRTGACRFGVNAGEMREGGLNGQLKPSSMTAESGDTTAAQDFNCP